MASVISDITLDDDDEYTAAVSSPNVSNVISDISIDEEEVEQSTELSTASPVVSDISIDEEDTQTARDVSSAVAPVSVEEKPAPEGYEYSMELLTDADGNTTAQRVLQKKVGRFEGTEYTDDAFTYEDTAAAGQQTLSSLYDTLSLIDRPLQNAFGDEFTVEYVPEYLRPFVRVVGQGVDGLIVQPILGTAEDATKTALGGLNTALQFGKETIQGIGTAVTRAVHEGITSESDAVKTLSSLPGSPSTKSIVALIQEGAKLLDVEGTDIIPVSPKTAGKQLTRDAVLALETAGIAGTAPALLARQATAPFRQAQKEIDDVTRAANRRIRVDEAKANEARIIAERKKKAGQEVRARANEADAEARETISQIEEELLDGQSISRETKSGKIAIDYDKAINLGQKKTDELLTGELAGDVELQEIVGTTNQLLHPILNPDKFEPVLAALLKMKDRFPDAFKKQKHLEGPYKGRKKTFGQQLKDLIIANSDEANKELTDIATEYGLTRDDLANMIMSGDRIAAQTLRQKGIALAKLRSSGKETPASKLDAAQTKHQKEFDDAVDALSTTVKNIKRIENITLGALTGTIGTAMRNLESFIARSPLEGLVRVMEDSVIAYTKRRQAAKDKDFVGPPEAPRLTDDELVVLAGRNPYATSLEALSNTFDATKGNRQQMQELVDYIMSAGGKEYDDVAKKLYSNIEELQLGYGRGEGKLLDAPLSGLEDLVQVLNAPNRWQEFHIRNGHYLGSIQRQVKQEWGIDFIETVNKSGIKNFLNDSSIVRPKGAKSFKQIVAEATQEALEITYAAAPKTEFGRSAISMFRKTPFASLLVAFPRFSLKAMEYLGASFVGAPYVLARRAVSSGKGRPNDRTLIAMNVAGGVGVAAAYQYRMSENAPADYTKIYTPNGNELDTTYLIPVPQMLWIGELLAQWRKGDGDVSDFLTKGGGASDFVKLFTGTNFKAGQQLGSLFTNLIDSISSDNALKAPEKVGRAVGDFVGSVAFRPFRPLTQVVDFERMAGKRPTEIRTFSSDPSMGFWDTFLNRVGKQFRNQGIFRSPEEEAKYPRKVVPFKPEGDSRVAPGLRLFAGMTIKTPSNEMQKWLTRRNFRQQYMFEGRTGIDTVDDVITETFNNLAIPVIQEIMNAEKVQLANANTREEKKEVYKNSRYLTNKFLQRIRSTASSSPMRFREGAVDEEGVRTTGTFDREFVMALARVKGLSSDDLAMGIKKFRETDDVPDGTALDFTDADILNGIATAGQVYSKEIRSIVNRTIPSLQ